MEARFDGGDITSDGGVLLLQQIDRRLGLTEAVARTQDNPRRQASCDHISFLPLYVFCRDQLLVSHLRPSQIDGAQHAWAILALLVKRLRQTWPQVQIILRGDSGFCRRRLLAWCERHDVGYIVGLAKNARLNALTAPLQRDAEACFTATDSKLRWFTDRYYAAGSWSRQRRVIVKLEHSTGGGNPRYVVTHLDGEGGYLYDPLYCARGEMENRIKELQLDLFADHTSCHRWWPNPFRLLLSSLAYTLLEAIQKLFFHVAARLAPSKPPCWARSDIDKTEKQRLKPAARGRSVHSPGRRPRKITKSRQTQSTRRTATLGLTWPPL